MTVLLHDQAEAEFLQSVSHYETQEPGLGERFKREVKEVVEWICRNPEVPRLRKGIYRRINLKVFPHFIAYVLRGEIIWIVAIAHGHRRPEFWLKRL
jgi:toxin ParE1/3/4